MTWRRRQNEGAFSFGSEERTKSEESKDLRAAYSETTLPLLHHLEMFQD